MKEGRRITVGRRKCENNSVNGKSEPQMFIPVRDVCIAVMRDRVYRRMMWSLSAGDYFNPIWLFWQRRFINLHRAKRRIDCLDYLVYNIERVRKMERK